MLPIPFLRVVVWLKKRDWGLSFMLAFVSFVAVIWAAVDYPGGLCDRWFEGPIFQAGVYVGAIFFPDYRILRSTGSYLVPLFGAAADFFTLMVIWLIVVRVVRRWRTEL